MIFSIVLLISIVLVVLLGHRRLPVVVLDNSGGIDLVKFDELRALELARAVTRSDVGTRYIGFTRKATDVVLAAVRRLCDEHERSSADRRLVCTVEVQQGDGAAHYARSGGYINYAAVVNVIVVVEPRQSQGSAELVLISAHLDSALGSPGGFDDGAGIGVVYESLRVVLARDSTGNQNRGFAFVFNSHEELGLLGATEFVEDASITRRIRAFINLEAAGHGGRPMLFQVGNFAIGEALRSLPWPRLSVIGQDLFRTGVLPADTDYRRYATVAGGVDLAWFEHGALYHTPRDSLEDEYFVGKEGSLQAMGENAIYLLYQLAQMKSFESKESAVFFDILGISSVVFSQSTMNAISMAVLVTFIVDLWREGLSFKTLSLELATVLLAVVAAIIGGGAAGFLTSKINPMAFYQSQWALLPLLTYGGVSCTLALLLEVVLVPLRRLRLLHALFLVAGLALGLGSSFLPAAILSGLVVARQLPRPARYIAVLPSLTLLLDVAVSLLELLRAMVGRMPS